MVVELVFGHEIPVPQATSLDGLVGLRETTKHLLNGLLRLFPCALFLSHSATLSGVLLGSGRRVRPCLRSHLVSQSGPPRDARASCLPTACLWKPLPPPPLDGL